MKQKGFTLIELLGVIVILSLLVLIITPVINVFMKDSKEDLYKKSISNIELAARNWVTDEENQLLLPKENGNCLILTLNDLKSGGYIDLDLKDPRSGKILDDEEVLVAITKKSKVFEYEIITNGDTSKYNCYTEAVDPTAPTITTNIFDGYKKNFDLVISYLSDYGFSTSNEYQYYLSSSSNALTNGSWTNYSNNVSQKIGTNLNGKYYLFVKRIANIDNIKSMLGGVLVEIGNNSYQRFGPYKFDNINPKWNFYKKTNTNSSNSNNLENLIYVDKEDTITITIHGTDLNYDNSNLSIANIQILVDGVDYTNYLTKSLSEAKSINNGVEYTLTIKNITQKGPLTLIIGANTLYDKAGNTNLVTIINTGIIANANVCSLTPGTVWEFEYTGAIEDFEVPCDGIYKLEAYGAQGGKSKHGRVGGKGGYASGNMFLTKDSILSVSVGDQSGLTNGTKAKYDEWDDYYNGGEDHDTEHESIGSTGGYTTVGPYVKGYGGTGGVCYYDDNHGNTDDPKEGGHKGNSGTGEYSTLVTDGIVNTGIREGNGYAKITYLGEAIKELPACEVGKTWEYAYTGTIQSLPIECAGTYKLEVYGAKGDGSDGGNGGYATGNITITKAMTLYIGVGSRLGYNGGGIGHYGESSSGSNGGGATHIATMNGLLPTLSENKNSVLIVAGGGGGSASYGSAEAKGGSGGGTTGGSGTEAWVDGQKGYGGTQTSGGSGSNHADDGKFGQGGDGASGGYSGGGGGGGGGWYGGGGGSGYGEESSDDSHQYGGGGEAAGGGGGSGYIGGVTGGSMTSGTNTGDGYAKITVISAN